MAKLNVRGAEMMEPLCRSLSVEYRRVGSYVIAFDEADLVHLQKLYENGVQNGVGGLRILSGAEARTMALLDRIVVHAPVSSGAVLASDILGTDVNIVATKSL